MSITISNPNFGPWTRVRNGLLIAGAGVALTASAIVAGSSLRSEDASITKVAVPSPLPALERDYANEPPTYVLYVVETQAQADLVNRAEFEIAMDAEAAGLQGYQRSHGILMADTPESSRHADESIGIMGNDLDGAGVNFKLADMRTGK